MVSERQRVCAAGREDGARDKQKNIEVGHAFGSKSGSAVPLSALRCGCCRPRGWWWMVWCQRTVWVVRTHHAPAAFLPPFLGGSILSHVARARRRGPSVRRRAHPPPPIPPLQASSQLRKLIPLGDRVLVKRVLQEAKVRGGGGCVAATARWC